MRAADRLRPARHGARGAFLRSSHHRADRRPGAQRRAPRQGDYSRPVDVARDDSSATCGPRSSACQRLRQTTVPGLHLNGVLGSMTDAVFVTSPTGHQGGELRRLPPAGLFGRSWSARASPRCSRSRAPGLDHTPGLERHARDAGAQPPGPDHPGVADRLADRQRRPAVQGVIFVARNITGPQARRAPHSLPRALRRADQRSRTGCGSSTCCGRRSRAAHSTTPRSRCCTSAWTGSRRSTTPSATPPATARSRCCRNLTRIVPKGAVVGRLAGDEIRGVHRRPARRADNRGPIAHLARTILDEVSAAYNVNQERGVPDREHRRRDLARATPRT